MTEEMPKNGELSLDMMYHTSGTQINLDYLSELDFIVFFTYFIFEPVTNFLTYILEVRFLPWLAFLSFFFLFSSKNYKN